MIRKKKYYVRSGLFDAISLSETAQQAAIDSCLEFLKEENELEPVIYAHPVGEKATVKNTKMISSEGVIKIIRQKGWKPKSEKETFPESGDSI